MQQHLHHGLGDRGGEIATEARHPLQRHRDGHARRLGRREGDEPHVVDLVADLGLGGARLPGDGDARDLRLVPVPPCTTATIIAVTADAVDGRMTTLCTLGEIVCTVRPSGSTMRWVRWGLMRRPWLATAATTSAI